jgi:hypothetical protein
METTAEITNVAPNEKTFEKPKPVQVEVPVEEKPAPVIVEKTPEAEKPTEQAKTWKQRRSEKEKIQAKKTGRQDVVVERLPVVIPYQYFNYDAVYRDYCHDLQTGKLSRWRFIGELVQYSVLASFYKSMYKWRRRWPLADRAKNQYKLEIYFHKKTHYKKMLHILRAVNRNVLGDVQQIDAFAQTDAKYKEELLKRRERTLAWIQKVGGDSRVTPFIKKYDEDLTNKHDYFARLRIGTATEKLAARYIHTRTLAQRDISRLTSIPQAA